MVVEGKPVRPRAELGSLTQPHCEPLLEPLHGWGAHFLLIPLQIQAPQALLSSASRKLSPLDLVNGDNQHQAAVIFPMASPWLILRSARGGLGVGVWPRDMLSTCSDIKGVSGSHRALDPEPGMSQTD